MARVIDGQGHRNRGQMLTECAGNNQDELDTGR